MSRVVRARIASAPNQRCCQDPDPRPLRSVVAWSRIFNDDEVLCAINTDPDRSRTAFVTIDDRLHAAGSRLTCVYSTDPNEIDRTLDVESRNGKAVKLSVPAAGFVIYA